MSSTRRAQTASGYSSGRRSAICGRGAAVADPPVAAGEPGEGPFDHRSMLPVNHFGIQMYRLAGGPPEATPHAGCSFIVRPVLLAVHWARRGQLRHAAPNTTALPAVTGRVTSLGRGTSSSASTRPAPATNATSPPTQNLPTGPGPSVPCSREVSSPRSSGPSPPPRSVTCPPHLCRSLSAGGISRNLGRRMDSRLPETSSASDEAAFHTEHARGRTENTHR